MNFSKIMMLCFFLKNKNVCSCHELFWDKAFVYRIIWQNIFIFGIFVTPLPAMAVHVNYEHTVKKTHFNLLVLIEYTSKVSNVVLSVQYCDPCSKHD